jgi:hypothetical protein
MEAWSTWQPPHGLVLTPPVVRDRAQDLFDQLFACDAAVALNTSAEIEAAIVGRPVLTIKAAELAPGQQGQLNFEYLLEENGGYVQTACTLGQHVPQLAAALAADPLAARRERFLATFVRPRGLNVRAGEVLADELERLLPERAEATTGGLGHLPERARIATAR